jgi:hypothetical protein
LNAEPYSFAVDTTGTICYIADARSIANGGGVQKWVLQDTIWVLTATFTNNISTGVYGITVDWSIPYPKIYATTPSQIMEITDSGSVLTSAVILNSASSNTAFRGIALVPILSQTSANDNQIPANSCLLTNYPNPFNPETTIEYRIQQSGFVSLVVYNVLGCKIADLVNEYKQSGKYMITFSGNGSPSGVYYYRLKTGSAFYTMKMLLVK